MASKKVARKAPKKKMSRPKIVRTKKEPRKKVGKKKAKSSARSGNASSAKTPAKKPEVIEPTPKLPVRRSRLKNANGINAQQQQFVDHYLKTLDVAAAALKAGYSPKTAAAIGSALLGKPEIQKVIQDAMTARAERTNITVDRVLEELAVVGFSSLDQFDIDDYGNVSVKEGVSREAIRSVAKLKKKITFNADGSKTITTDIGLWDKPAGLRMMGQHLVMFTEKHEHLHKVSHEDQLDELE